MKIRVVVTGTKVPSNWTDESFIVFFQRLSKHQL
jgi:hypothetical protein